MLSVFVVFYLFSIALQTGAQNPVITIKNGRIKGRLSTTDHKAMTYSVFQGIPYAKPPIGERRFKPAEPMDDWNGTLDATQYRDGCVQGIDNVLGSEDCLFINVYVPTIIKNEPIAPTYPVMVWIYGGGFIAGLSSIEFVGPDYFISEHVILVTFNYRLGIFGFLSTEDEFSPGNNGLKDQLFALRWVQENIRYFGGDKNRVTVFGQSAGGASIVYHLQSPLAKGLFNRAIVESGSSLCLWAYSRNPKHLTNAIGKALFVDTYNSTTLLDGLRTIDFKILQSVSMKMELLRVLTTNILQGLPFAPSEEPDLPGSTVVGKSHQKLSECNVNKVPILIGFNSLEGLEFAIVFSGTVRPYRFSYDLLPERLVPIDMNLRWYQKILKTYLGFKIKLQYFGRVNAITYDDVSLAKMVSDQQFMLPIHETVRLFSECAEVYFYRFAFQGMLGGTQNYPGVPHSNELFYLWKVNFTSGSPADYTTVKRMVKLWTNFAKSGNPTPTRDPLLQNVKWPVANYKSPTNLTYLNIDKALKVMSGPEEVAVEFWNNLYDEFGNPPYDTY